MSASSKKKLRAAENAEKLTEKQLAEQTEAKKLKTLTTIFVVVMAVMVLAAAIFGVTKAIENSGIRERNTVAVTIGEHEISNAELNYFFIDSVNKFVSDYGDYAAWFGLDTTKPLDEQYVDEASGLTWADDFMADAVNTAKSVYALVDAANAAGYTLSESEQTEVTNAMSSMELYAMYYGYSDVEAYIKAMYGSGATVEGLQKYFEMSYLADSYKAAYTDALTYTDADLRAAEAENYNEYSSYSYNYYYMPVSKFLTGGTTDAEGKTTYSDEENAAAAAAALAAAEELVNGEYTGIADFDAAIAALSINAEVENAASSAYTNNSYSGVSSLYSEWITDSARTEGDMTYVPSTTTAEDGTETVTGYYVVYYVGSNDNTFPLANVRHILVAFEGGSYDSTTGVTTYSDEEKLAAKKAADELYAQWKSGKASEETFIELANAESDDGDGTTGGLYTDIYPGQMVTNFNDWCFAEGRQNGDTGIVESEYGYHIMFYVGDSETTYRDFMITNALTSADVTAWFNGLVEALTVVDGDTKYINTNLVLSNG